MNQQFLDWLEEQKYSWNNIPKKMGANYNNVDGWVLYSVMKDIIGERNMKSKLVWMWEEILEVEIGTDNKIKYEQGF